MTQVYETDWLASRPVFYNERTGKVSYNINDVIDYANLEFHAEGFNNYLDLGYSVFEQTPVKHVKFLRYSSRLTVHDDGRLEVEYLDDPVEKWIGRKSREDDVWHLLETAIRRWEKSVEGEIIIPTSGGYDSRLLNFFIEDKSRVRSFSYGLSWNQAESSEVVYARKLSEILGTRWEQISLGDFHRYFDEWESLFGISTHAHGMYHIEFYRKISSKVKGGNPFLSGIIGDAWAGSVAISDIESPGDVKQLGYNHGINADSSNSQVPSHNWQLEEYFTNRRQALKDPLLRVVEAMRFKIILLCYLIKVPRSFRFTPWSPFLDVEVAMTMLNLSPERRRDRQWQKDFFHEHGLDVESMHLNVNHTNLLDLCALYRHPVEPLSVTLLRELLKPNYVEWINRNLHYSYGQRLLDDLLNIRKVGGALRRLGLVKFRDEILKAYFAYLVLLPIQNLMKKRKHL